MDENEEDCPKCGGDGEIAKHFGASGRGESMLCDRCGGTGSVRVHLGRNVGIA